jgi:hypothetical protein
MNRISRVATVYRVRGKYLGAGGHGKGGAGGGEDAGEVRDGVGVRLIKGLPRGEEGELRPQQPCQLQLLPPPLRHDMLRRLDVAQLRHAQPRVEQLVLHV